MNKEEKSVPHTAAKQVKQNPETDKVPENRTVSEKVSGSKTQAGTGKKGFPKGHSGPSQAGGQPKKATGGMKGATKIKVNKQKRFGQFQQMGQQWQKGQGPKGGPQGMTGPAQRGGPQMQNKQQGGQQWQKGQGPKGGPQGMTGPAQRDGPQMQNKQQGGQQWQKGQGPKGGPQGMKGPAQRGGPQMQNKQQGGQQWQKGQGPKGGPQGMTGPAQRGGPQMQNRQQGGQQWQKGQGPKGGPQGMTGPAQRGGPQMQNRQQEGQQKGNKIQRVQKWKQRKGSPQGNQGPGQQGGPRMQNRQQGGQQNQMNQNRSNQRWQANAGGTGFGLQGSGGNIVNRGRQQFSPIRGSQIQQRLMASSFGQNSGQMGNFMAGGNQQFSPARSGGGQQFGNVSQMSGGARGYDNQNAGDWGAPATFGRGGSGGRVNPGRQEGPSFAGSRDDSQPLGPNFGDLGKLQGIMNQQLDKMRQQMEQNLKKQLKDQLKEIQEATENKRKHEESAYQSMSSNAGKRQRVSESPYYSEGMEDNSFARGPVGGAPSGGSGGRGPDMNIVQPMYNRPGNIQKTMTFQKLTGYDPIPRQLQSRSFTNNQSLMGSAERHLQSPSDMQMPRRFDDYASPLNYNQPSTNTDRPSTNTEIQEATENKRKHEESAYQSMSSNAGKRQRVSESPYYSEGMEDNSFARGPVGGAPSGGSGGRGPDMNIEQPMYNRPGNIQKTMTFQKLTGYDPIPRQLQSRSFTNNQSLMGSAERHLQSPSDMQMPRRFDDYASPLNYNQPSTNTDRPSTNTEIQEATENKRKHEESAYQSMSSNAGKRQRASESPYYSEGMEDNSFARGPVGGAPSGGSGGRGPDMNIEHPMYNRPGNIQRVMTFQKLTGYDPIPRQLQSRSFTNNQSLMGSAERPLQSPSDMQMPRRFDDYASPVNYNTNHPSTNTDRPSTNTGQYYSDYRGSFSGGYN